MVVIEFTDYQCPFCGRFANETFGRVIRDYVTSGRVQYVLKTFPLEDAHPLAAKLAQAAACAGEQGKYWETHERLFRNQGTETPDLLPVQEKTLGLNETRFRLCIDGPESLMKVKTDVSEAKRLGLDATPTFLFGFRDSKDPTKIRAVKMLTGAQPQFAFEQILEYLLIRHPHHHPEATDAGFLAPYVLPRDIGYSSFTSCCRRSYNDQLRQSRRQHVRYDAIRRRGLLLTPSF